MRVILNNLALFREAIPYFGGDKSNHHTPVTNVSRQWREWCHKKGVPQGCPSEIHTAQSLTYMTWSTARSVDRTDHHACVNVPILCAIQSDTAGLKIKKKKKHTNVTSTARGLVNMAAGIFEISPSSLLRVRKC